MQFKLKFKILNNNFSDSYITWDRFPSSYIKIS